MGDFGHENNESFADLLNAINEGTNIPKLEYRQ